MEKIPEISVLDLCKILNVEPIYSNLTITHISINSKETSREKFCYIAIKGKRFDGYDFIDEAIKNGARVIISEKPIFSSNAIIILVENAIVALGLIAKYSNRSKNNICITGSVGKTTVAKMIKLILEEKYKVNSTIKNFNNEIGVPMTLLKGEKNSINVIELGMRGKGEIDYLSGLCEPNIAIVTNIGTSHIGILGSKEEIFKAKTEVFLHTKNYAIVPNEARFKSVNYKQISPIFIGDNGDCFIKEYSYYSEGLKFSVEFKGQLYENIKIKSFSLHNLINSMYGIVVGFINGLTIEEIKCGLIKYKGDNMREEIININGITIIMDCYNASFESMKSALLMLSKYAELKNKTPKALIGDMLEQGEYSAELHYRIGELAKDCGIKSLFVVGKYSKYLMDGYSGGYCLNDVLNLPEIIANSIEEKDVLLVKGSREIKLEKIVEKMRNIL